MKLNNILYSLTKNQTQCLIVVALAEKKYTKPTIVDLRNTISVACNKNAHLTFKWGSRIPAATQNLQNIGCIQTKRIHRYIVESRKPARGSNPSLTYHLTDIGKSYLMDKVLNRA